LTCKYYPLYFSVVIPLYNRAQYIQKAIHSVLSQTYLNYELIVVDDASTDNSVEKVKEISDPKIKIICLEKNGGNAKSRNIGWQSARGDWVVYLDSDDWLESSYLDYLSKTIRLNPKLSFCWSAVRYVNSSNEVLKEEYWQPRKALPSDTFFDELRIGTNCGVAFKRKILEKFNGFDEDLRASVDREFFLRISEKVQGGGIDKVLINCLIGDHDSVRKDYDSQFSAYSKMMLRFKSQIEATASRKKWWHHKSMWLALYTRDFHMAIEHLKELGYQKKSLILFLTFLLLPVKLAISLHKGLAPKGL